MPQKQTKQKQKTSDKEKHVRLMSPPSFNQYLSSALPSSPSLSVLKPIDKQETSLHKNTN